MYVDRLLTNRSLENFEDFVSLNYGGCFDKIVIEESNYIALVAVKTPLNICYENFKIKFLLFSPFLRTVCGGGGVRAPGY